MKHLIVCAALLVAAQPLAAAERGFDFFERVQPPRRFQAMVHRGAMAQAPENTRPALERVIEDGLEWAEIDVRLTRDRQHVIFHDTRLEGKTNGTGPLDALSLEEL